MLRSLARPALRRAAPRHSLLRPQVAAMSSLSDEFAKKVALGKTLPPLSDNAAKLEMYALYKQANVGKVNKPRPGMLDFVGRAMWDAWNKLGDMGQEEAMQKCVHRHFTTGKFHVRPVTNVIFRVVHDTGTLPSSTTWRPSTARRALEAARPLSRTRRTCSWIFRASSTSFSRFSR